jgi:hypothetical protein
MLNRRWGVADSINIGGCLEQLQVHSGKCSPIELIEQGCSILEHSASAEKLGYPQSEPIPISRPVHVQRGLRDQFVEVVHTH